MVLEKLKALCIDMQRQNAYAMAFSAYINGHGFSCTFSIANVPYHLYVTTLGLAPFTIDFEISKFEIVTNPILSGEEYRQLCKYLNLHYDKDNPFRPVNFLYEINKKSPLKYDRKAAVHQYELVRLAVNSHLRQYDEDEVDKVYFCGWKTNPSGKKVTVSNYRKTLQYFSKEEADMRRKLNQSSCWTSNPDEERLDLLNQYIPGDSIVK